jgi:hypothetical protein
MKKAVIFILCTILAGAGLLEAQDTTHAYSAPVPARKNYINSGFYFQVGPVFPNGNYAYDQLVPVTNPNPPVYALNYLPAQIGAAMDMGFLIYLGPSFANNHLRAGIDATFLSFWFNSTKPVDPANKYEHYYYYAGQKFGPVITINPIDRLMIDISYKINANVAYHFDEWHSLLNEEYSKYGVNLTQNEISLGIRYIIMKFAIQYNFGKMKYNNVDNSRPYQTIDANTLRIMVGLKF